MGLLQMKSRHPNQQRCIGLASQPGEVRITYFASKYGLIEYRLVIDSGFRGHHRSASIVFSTRFL